MATSIGGRATRSEKQKPLPLGTRLVFIYGVTPREGVIVEHRGPLGPNGAFLYGVTFGEDSYIELTTDQFELRK